MTWPQIVITLWFLLNVGFVAITVTRDTKISVTTATTTVLLFMVVYGALSWVLRAGGFW